LRFFDTVDTARDIDRIRVAANAKQITYLGYSYGTELGWVYLRLFPASVRAAVLDAGFDPTV
jgi:pimeloyl-ACP methyl ester carboxylesterase